MQDIVEVRKAVTEDADGIARVQVETWRVAYADWYSPEYLDSLSVEERRRSWEAAIESRDSSRTIFVAINRAGELVGFANSGPSRDQEANEIGELYAIYVSSSCWNRGIGKKLLLINEASLLASGFSETTLWTLRNNVRTRAFYEANGWCFDGTEKAEERPLAVHYEVRYRKRLTG